MKVVHGEGFQPHGKGPFFGATTPPTA